MSDVSKLEERVRILEKNLIKQNKRIVSSHLKFHED